MDVRCLRCERRVLNAKDVLFLNDVGFVAWNVRPTHGKRRDENGDQVTHWCCSEGRGQLSSREVSDVTVHLEIGREVRCAHFIVVRRIPDRWNRSNDGAVRNPAAGEARKQKNHQRPDQSAANHCESIAQTPFELRKRRCDFPGAKPECRISKGLSIRSESGCGCGGVVV